MGIPYSRQINAAFGQVTPLVEEGFRVLQTIKNIAILIAFVQITTVILLSLIFFALIGLLVTVNPDLQNERQRLVTPAVRWIAQYSIYIGGRVKRHWWVVLLWMLFVIGGAGFLYYTYRMKQALEESKEGLAGGEADGEDVAAIREGKSNQ
ncbi:hypothetical protein LTS18_003785 [Coniosporium uncinatum]|uniref:Uncharacterized protein n=1 Tax=Coniosporium uncinatum TaxID=93489 RepID=A0ACC3DBC3_9PEZI|nr:hypothetical protein LTS18_003785 [Coniosporium uncinatum]